MGELIEYTKEIIADPDRGIAEKATVVGNLAIAVVAGGFSDALIAEAQAVIRSFWQQIGGAR